MFRYTCLNPIAQVGLNGFDDTYEKAETLADADAVLVRSAKLHEMELPEKLCAIARAGAGVNNIPLDKCADHGIVVFNTPGANANGVKELVFAGMLLAARDIIGGANWVQSQDGNADVAAATEKEKKKFAGYDPYISVDAAWNLSREIHHINDVDEIYRQCDYITIHVPLLDSTKKMINADAIAKMKDHVVILNFARDLLVDEEAVVAAIEAGKVHRYVSDFPNPTTVGKKGVIVTPHLGASTVESEDNCAVMAVKELRNFLENGTIKNSVNYPACDPGVCESISRIAICHRNVKGMIRRFTDILSDTNIHNMSNASKGDYAYTLLDLDSRVPEEMLSKIEEIEEVLRVRVVK